VCCMLPGCGWVHVCHVLRGVAACVACAVWRVLRGLGAGGAAAVCCMLRGVAAWRGWRRRCAACCVAWLLGWVQGRRCAACCVAWLLGWVRGWRCAACCVAWRGCSGGCGDGGVEAVWGWRCAACCVAWVRGWRVVVVDRGGCEGKGGGMRGEGEREGNKCAERNEGTLSKQDDVELVVRCIAG
jgi:hypothetical protein